MIENQNQATSFQSCEQAVTREPVALPKHQYPFYIKIFFGLVVCMSFIMIPRFLLYDLPDHRLIHTKLVEAKKAFDEADYAYAIDCYTKVVSIYPRFKEGKIALAKSLFARCAETNLAGYFQFGMWYLDGDKYSYAERQAMQAYLPTEYQQEFKDAWRSV